MAQLVIKGHQLRSNEVIEILEMLGGKNSTKLVGSASSCGYYIDSNGNIAYRYYSSFNDAIQFTIEEFLEKYPYKIGDKVKCWINGYCSINNIKSIQWDSIVNEIKYKIQDYWYSTMNLQPYKEETMEETIIDTIRESEDRYRIKVNYQFDIEVDEGEYYAVRRKPQYPKTYEECCKVLLLKPERATYSVSGLEYKRHLIVNLQRLLICRDAYWKIAGEQMGLDKPWEPDWTNNYQKKWTIGFYQGEINLTTGPNVHLVLAFPTAEMRDAFYENFKELIESCKELL